MGFVCFRCGLVLQSIRYLLNHLRRDHLFSDRSHLKCGQPNCLAEYNNFNAFQRHLHRIHYADELQDVPSHDQHDIPAVGLHDCQDSDMPDETSNIFVADHQPLTRMDLMHFIDRYVYCELRKDATVAQTVIDKVVDGITNFCHEIMTCLDAQVTKVVDKHGLDEDKEVINLRNTIHLCKSPFEGFRSKHDVDKFYESHEGFVKPSEHFLGYRWDTRLEADNVYQQTLVSDSFQFVSIIETLQMVAHDEGVCHYLTLNRRRNDGVLEDFCDGRIYYLSGKGPAGKCLLA
jgi:hypothetical protein